MLKNSVRI